MTRGFWWWLFIRRGEVGWCFLQEFYYLLFSWISDSFNNGDLCDTKIYADRNFGIVNKENGVNPLDIIRKYMYLRLAHIAHNFFFLNFRNRECTRTIEYIGINKFYKAPETMANYLKLNSPARNTGHCFKWSSVKFWTIVGVIIVRLITKNMK